MGGGLELAEDIDPPILAFEDILCVDWSLKSVM
jgi:hypothetical protein